MSQKGSLSVMVPAFNEERTLQVILKHVLEQPEVGEVIAVDDGSTDGTWAIMSRFAANDPRVRAFRLEANQGKGAALRRAVEEVRMPFALVQDADLEYDPRDYPTLLRPLVEGRADVVYGVRGFAGQTAFSFWFVMGNKAVTFAANILFDCYISDLESGYKALRSDLWRRLNLQGKRFDIEPDITARVLRLGYRIHEVPIRYYARELSPRAAAAALAAPPAAALEARPEDLGERFGDPGGPDPGEATSSGASASVHA